MIQISDAQVAEIRAHAHNAYPYECCGALLGTVNGDAKTVLEVRRLNNAHRESHQRRYEVSAEDMLMLMEEERSTESRVLGFYHSHPDHPAEPSDYDRDCAAPWYTYLIVTVTKSTAGDVTAWRLDPDTRSFVAERIAGPSPTVVDSGAFEERS